MRAAGDCGIPAAAIGLAAPAEADVERDSANQLPRTAAARRATTPRSRARSYASDSTNAWTSTPTGRPNPFRATCGEPRRGRPRADPAIE